MKDSRMNHLEERRNDMNQKMLNKEIQIIA